MGETRGEYKCAAWVFFTLSLKWGAHSFFYKYHAARDFTLFFPIFDKHQLTSPKNIELLFKPNESLVYLMRKTPIKSAKSSLLPPFFLKNPEMSGNRDIVNLEIVRKYHAKLWETMF